MHFQKNAKTAIAIWAAASLIASAAIAQTPASAPATPTAPQKVQYDQAIVAQVNGVRAKISAGEKAGGLTPAEITDFNTQLDAILVVKHTADGSDNGLSTAEYNDVKGRLSTLTKAVSAKAGDGNTDLSDPGKLQREQAVTTQVNDIRVRIDGGTRDKKLTAGESKNLSDRLQNIIVSKRKLASSEMGLNQNEYNNIKSRLDILSTDVNTQVNDKKPG